MGHEASAVTALGVYHPRRPRASPLVRSVQDHLHRLQAVYDERFARQYGPWRSVVGQVADRFLACGILEHGFARIRCDACAQEYLLAFSCRAATSARPAAARLLPLPSPPARRDRPCRRRHRHRRRPHAHG